MRDAEAPYRGPFVELFSRTCRPNWPALLLRAEGDSVDDWIEHGDRDKPDAPIQVRKP
jgi:hypothetical protein